MKKFNVEIWGKAYYPEIEAETVEEAKNIAWDWFLERTPQFLVEEVKENELA